MLISKQTQACMFFSDESQIRDMFHVYLNKFEFQFLMLHINKTKKICFFMHNGRVPGIAK